MTDGAPALSYVAESVRRYDRDRFLAALFAPPPSREHLMALYAFNLEISKTREAVSEPMIGMIRLQWWRDALSEIYETERPRRHEVVQALAAAITDCGLGRAEFEALIDARERDLEDTSFSTVEALETYAEETTVPLLRLALLVLGLTGGDVGRALRGIGTGYALGGLMRALPHQVRGGRVPIPEELMQRHRIDRGALLAMKPSPALTGAVETVCNRARQHLRAGRRAWPGPVRPAAPVLIGIPLAASHLRRLRRVGHDPFDPRLAGRPPMLAAELWLRVLLGRY